MTPLIDTRAPLGWPLLPLPDASGGLSWPDLARSVREQIQVLLSTRPGEQLMRPGFGAGLENLLGEPNTIATRSRIRELVQKSLERWEPRITVEAVSVEPVADGPDTEVSTGVCVEIVYRLVRTQVVARVGLTLALEG